MRISLSYNWRLSSNRCRAHAILIFQHVFACMHAYAHGCIHRRTDTPPLAQAQTAAPPSHSQQPHAERLSQQPSPRAALASAAIQPSKVRGSEKREHIRMQCTCLFAASKIRMHDLVGFSVNVDVCVWIPGPVVCQDYN